MTTVKSLPEGQVHLGSGVRTAHQKIVGGVDVTGFDVLQLFSLPAGAIVLDLQYIVTGAFTASTTVTFGDGDDPDRFIDATLDVPTAEGGASMKQDAQPGSGGHIYSAADTVDAVFAGATPTAGTMEVFLTYLISNEYPE